MQESYDEIYNGPRHYEPIKATSLDSIGSDMDSAFAHGRDLYKQGRPVSYLTALGKRKHKSLVKEMRRGYNWQKSRTPKAVSAVLATGAPKSVATPEPTSEPTSDAPHSFEW